MSEITPMDAYFRKLFGKRNIQTTENKALENMRRLEEERKSNMPNVPEMDGFIYVPSINLYMAKERTLKGKTWNQTHEILQKDNKFMPSIYHFTEYLNYLKNDHEDRDEAETILDDILKTGDWRAEWLDAKFEKKKDGLYLLSDHRIENKKLIAKSEQPLEKCVMEDCYVNFDFNSQGLPVSKSKSQNYSQGDNICLGFPRDGRVAWFGVYSDYACLYCNYYVPDYSYVSLGVFPCAEGASQKI